VFQALNNAAIFKDISNKFENENGFQTAILRFGVANKAFQDARLLVYEGRWKESNELSFTCSSDIKEAYEAHVVDFDFIRNNNFPLRINVIIEKKRYR
jgi:hypothetical protein